MQTLTQAPRRADSQTTDDELFETIERAMPQLRARALRLTGRPDRADDLVQDTVERALRFRASYIPGTRAKAWLHQILFSVFVTRYRRSKRERRVLDRVARDPNAWPRPVVERPDTAAGLSRSTTSMLEALPAAHREVVRLVDLDGWSYRDAAEALEVPLGTVMSRLFRARRSLRRALESFGGAPTWAAQPA